MMISFKGKHFLKDIILMVVCWYVSYSLSYRDIEELMLERGTKVDHSTLNRWIIEFAPLLENELWFKKIRMITRNIHKELFENVKLHMQEESLGKFS